MITKDTSIIEILKFDNPSSGIGSIEQLCTLLSQDPFNVEVKTKDRFVLLKYSQIDSDLSYKLVQDCRGIILDKMERRIVCRPFSKFFNYSEPLAAKVNFDDNAVVSSKIDGSLLKIWWYDGEWKVSTNGTIDAKDACVNTDTSTSFHDLFLEAEKNTPIPWDRLATDSCHMYELVHPKSRVVINYLEPRLYYLGSRVNATGEEYRLDIDPRPKVYSFKTIDDILNMSKELPYDDEGYVITDSNFNRVKVKGLKYLIASHMRLNGPVTPKRILDVLLRGEEGEFLSYFPDFRDQFNIIGHDLSIYIDQIRDEFTGLWRMNLPTRKEYAAEALKTINSSVMFRYYGKEPTKEVLEDMFKFIWGMGADKLSQLIYGDEK